MGLVKGKSAKDTTTLLILCRDKVFLRLNKTINADFLQILYFYILKKTGGVKKWCKTEKLLHWPVLKIRDVIGGSKGIAKVF